MDNNWNVKIIDVGYKFTKDIFIYRKLPEGRMEILNGDGTAEIISSYEATRKPTLELDDSQLRAFANALNAASII